MHRSFVLLSAGVFACGLSASPSPAQDLARAPTPIEVRVSPPSASPGPPVGGQAGPSVLLVVQTGTAVRIHGTTVPFGQATQRVRITVKPPSGADTVLTATVAADMKFSVQFTGTTAPGPYVVTALAPDNRATAAVTFTVGTFSDITTAVENLVRTLDRVASDAAAGLAAVRTSLDNKGPYPNQAQINQNLARADALLREYPARLATVRQALSRVADVAREYPGGAGELEPYTTAIAEATQQSEASGERLRTLTPQVRRDSGLCDAIDTGVAVLGAASLWFDLTGKFYTKVIQLAADKYLPGRVYNAAVPPANRTPGREYAVGETLKAVGSMLSGTIENPAVGAGRGMVSFVTSGQNLLLDTQQAVMGLVFSHFCEQFTGPFTGTFKLDATVNGGEKFWGYTMTFGGILTARYEKARPRPGEAVAVTGEFEGNGFWKMYEDLMALNPYNRRFVLFKYLVQPIGWSGTMQQLTDPLGKLARMLTPAYFRIPVTGTVTAGQLTIKVADRALIDFSDLVRGRALYVVMPPGSPAPYVLNAPIPVQKAQFIISRGLRVEAALPIVTTGQGPTMIKTVQKAFDRRDAVANGEITVSWGVNLKACNPGCE